MQVVKFGQCQEKGSHEAKRRCSDLQTIPFYSLGVSIDLNIRVKIYEKKYFLQLVSNLIAAQVLPELLAIARQLAMQLSCCKSHGEAGKAGRGYCLLLCPLVLGTKSDLHLFLCWAVLGGGLSPRCPGV